MAKDFALSDKVVKDIYRLFKGYKITKHRSYSGSVYLKIFIGKRKAKIRISNHVPYKSKLEKYNVMLNNKHACYVTRSRYRYYGYDRLKDLKRDIMYVYKGESK